MENNFKSSPLRALWHLPVVNAECVLCHLLRGIQAGLSSARCWTGPGCRQGWLVLDWAALTQTDRVCMLEWLASRTSSRTQYPRSGCMAELIKTGSGGQPCCSAACPLYWSCFWNKNFFFFCFNLWYHGGQMPTTLTWRRSSILYLNEVL